MYREAFPGCCAGIVVYNLDEEYARQHSEWTNAKSKETIRQEVLANISAVKTLYTFMLVTTNSNQTVSREVLRELEFKELEHFSSSHEGITITLWSKRLELYPDRSQDD